MVRSTVAWRVNLLRSSISTFNQPLLYRATIQPALTTDYKFAHRILVNDKSMRAATSSVEMDCEINGIRAGHNE